VLDELSRCSRLTFSIAVGIPPDSRNSISRSTDAVLAHRADPKRLHTPSDMLVRDPCGRGRF